MVLFLVAAFLAHGVPSLHPNECLYLIPGRQVIDESFLAHDWTVGREAEPTFEFAFSLLAAPVWALGLSPVEVALTLRAGLWVILAATLAVFSRKLDLPLLPSFAGLSLWVFAGQPFAAGEWIVGGAEPKTVSYAAVFMALGMGATRRWLLMSVWLAIATVFHVLVGGWSAVCLFGVLLLRRDLIAGRDLVKASAVVLVLVSPILFFALAAMLKSDPSQVLDNGIEPFASPAEMIVKFRNPHHVDPLFFLTAANAVKAAVVVVGSFLALRVLPLCQPHRVLMGGFLLATLLIAVAGAAARGLGQYWFLQFYPFRVADGVYPVTCYMLLGAALPQVVRSFRTQKLRSKVYASAVCALSVALVVEGADDVTRRTREVIDSWHGRLSGIRDDPRETMYAWIRKNTSEESVFLAPPWWNGFWLLAERPMLVTMKATPTGRRSREWYSRMRLANDEEEFNGRGFRIYPQLQRNFRRLSQEKLLKASATRGVRYYLVDVERPDLSGWQLVHADHCFLYEISPDGSEHPGLDDDRP